ncbi:MAG: OmpA family protein [Planctomycetota bacterium]
MAIAKKQRPAPSCPLWLATYGDLVTNMLVFFVLLVSMSEIKKDDRFVEFMQALREAFGYVGGMETVPYEQVFQPKNVDLMQLLMVPVRPFDWSEAPDPGVRGKHHNVTNIRREEKFEIGGKFRFPELVATLQPEHDALIAEYVEKLRGHRTQIELRGHCSRVPVAGTDFPDHFALSVARARAVADVLIQHGVEAERIVVVGVGANEPIAVEAYSPAERQENDRVEVLQVNRRVEDFTSPSPSP